jgi:hypothetical protein
MESHYGLLTFIINQYNDNREIIITSLDIAQKYKDRKILILVPTYGRKNQIKRNVLGLNLQNTEVRAYRQLLEGNIYDESNNKEHELLEYNCVIMMETELITSSECDQAIKHIKKNKSVSWLYILYDKRQNIFDFGKRFL